MTDTKHTPGPWEADPDSDLASCTDFAKASVDIHTSSGNSLNTNQQSWVARVVAHTDKATVAANARLIASAPDLLAALEVILGSPALNMDDLEPCDKTAIDQARAAIALATGRAGR